MWRSRALVAMAMTLLATRAAAEDGATLSANASRQPAMLRGLAALDSGVPLMRWPLRSAAAAIGAPDDRGGAWLRLGHDGEAERAAPGAGRRMPARSVRIASPLPFLSVTGGDEFYGQLWLRFGARIGLRTEYHVVDVGDARHPWGAVGEDVRRGDAAARRALAHVAALGMTVALSDHLAVGAQYGHAFGAALARAGAADAAAHYGYIELTLRY